MPEKEASKRSSELRRQNSSAKNIAISGGGRMESQSQTWPWPNNSAPLHPGQAILQQETSSIARAEALGQRG